MWLLPLRKLMLVRLLKPYIDKENNRAGAKLISGGAY